MKWLNRSIRFFGIFLLVFILWKVDLGQVFTLLSDANFGLVVMAYLLSIVIIFVKALRWRNLLTHADISFPLWMTFISNWIGIYLAKFTPGALGDFVRLYYLKEKGYSFSRSFATCFIDRLFDVFALGLFGLLGVYYVDVLFGLDVSKWTIIGAVVVLGAIGLALAVQKHWIKAVIKFMYRKLVPQKLKETAKVTYTDLISQITSLPVSVVLPVLFWTFLSWLVYFYQMQLLAAAVGISISLFKITIVMAFTNFVVLLPISIGGLGTRDATIIALLGLMSIGWEQALSFSLLIMGNNIFVALGGALLWWMYPVKIKE